MSSAAGKRKTTLVVPYELHLEQVARLAGVGFLGKKAQRTIQKEKRKKQPPTTPTPPLPNPPPNLSTRPFASPPRSDSASTAKPKILRTVGPLKSPAAWEGSTAVPLSVTLQQQNAIRK